MDILFSFLLASVLLTLSPGPDLLMVIAQSIEKGAKTAFLFVAGLLTGLLGHTALLIFGWAQFIGERPQVVTLIQWIGFVYFSFLGLSSIYSYFKRSLPQADKKKTMLQHPYVQGVVMNGINPKVSLFFWLFFPGFLFSSSLSIAVQYAVLGVLFLVQAAVVFSGVILLANQFKAFFQRYRLDFISGVLWLILAVYVVLA